MKKIRKGSRGWVIPEEYKGLGIRIVSKELKSFHDEEFTWPKRGYCEAEDWNPEPECGEGLHFIPYGIGGYDYILSFPRYVAQLIEYDTREMVLIKEPSTKAKVPRCNVIGMGTLAEVLLKMRRSPAYDQSAKERWKLKSEIDTDPCVDWDGGNVQFTRESYSNSIVITDKLGIYEQRSVSITSGVKSHAISVGDTPVAISTGRGDGIAAGENAIALVVGTYSRASSHGKNAVSISTKMASGAESGGTNNLSIVLGQASAGRAGKDGALIIAWIDDSGRRRYITGYVGEDIKADTWYTVENGKLKEC